VAGKAVEFDLEKEPAFLRAGREKVLEVLLHRPPIIAQGGPDRGFLVK
jgi:hypothetical protein